MGYATSRIALGAAKKQLKKERFLKEMLQVMPWDEMCDLIRPYYKGREKGGRRKMDLQLMLKIHCLQQWFGLSDPGVEEEIYDRITFQKFLDIDLLNDNIPDETTVLNFRHLLEDNDLQQQMFELINDILEKKGLIMRKGTLVDATIIAAPSSTKNKDSSRDPEMASTKKGNNYHFGMKGHVGVDGDTGVVHTVTYTGANEHDSTQIEALLHGEEKYVSGDKAYGKKERKREYRANGVTYGILDKAARGKKLSSKQEKRNKKRQRIKAKVEHPFQVLKCQWNYRKVRYRGLKKNGGQIVLLMGLVNLFKMRKYILATC